MSKQAYARVVRTIWTDSDFRALSALAQWLYFTLLTAPGTTLAGICDWRPRRLAAYAQALPAEAVESAGEELSALRFVCFDHDTEEALIRTFVRHDGMLKQPNMAKAVAKEYGNVASAYLRGVLVWELKRLKRDEPGLHWEHLAEVLRNPSVNPSRNPSPNPSDDPSGKGCPTPYSLLPTPNSSPSSLRSVTRGVAHA